MPEGQVQGRQMCGLYVDEWRTQEIDEVNTTAQSTQHTVQ